MMNTLTPEQRRRGLANVKKLRADLEVISERQNFTKRNFIQRIKIKAGQLRTMTTTEYTAKYGKDFYVHPNH
ncbi:hypothetical protein FR932_06895 [Moritella marina ATCC 15381]|uniref:Uncharacterized protein n=1 Tax=Moritella marina ATCC 15381 TaxID=1202962 RepID=A0A5J6WHR7_MORMI|nr:hypothetical protein [Moritella marina]QFI37586.1 hypothetical protein FR932_06895 [Moritella marina ATCC 15381]